MRSGNVLQSALRSKSLQMTKVEGFVKSSLGEVENEDGFETTIRKGEVLGEREPG